jgi:bacterioferritin-associated ferredoxin
MIVCHCNRIDHSSIESTADSLTRVDPWRILTPVLVYKALGKRPQCGGCLPLAANVIHTRKVSDLSCCQRCPMAALVEEEVTVTEETVEISVTAVVELGS